MNPRLRSLSTTLALVALGLGYGLIQAKPWRPPPPLVARSAEAVQRPAPPPLPPSAREILDRSAALSLTANQKARLTALDEKWRKELTPLKVAIETAGEDFSQFMREAEAGGKTSLQEIQRRSEEFRRLNAELREGRRHHAEAAAQILTESQRRKLAPPTSPNLNPKFSTAKDTQSRRAGRWVPGTPREIPHLGKTNETSQGPI